MTTPEFQPSHVVPPDGMPAWSAPDAARPTVPLDPLLPVQVIDRLGDWALALCHNGWSAWVDGRLLLSIPHGPPAAAAPPTRTTDPRPLLGGVESELGRYRRLVEELVAGRLDGEAFGQQTRGMRVGVVMDGEAVWLYDARHERWCYCDGVSLETYAVTAGPSKRSREGETPDPPASAPPPTAPYGSYGSYGASAAGGDAVRGRRLGG
ncbi:hypothetical protein [Streptomyces chattanoogensis]|uniref:hypothetical protein n=1 Tax=Streptomyces chattanoogensis TaxID=66876 RepID=UPI0036B1D915